MWLPTATHRPTTYILHTRRTGKISEKKQNASVRRSFVVAFCVPSGFPTIHRVVSCRRPSTWPSIVFIHPRPSTCASTVFHPTADHPPGHPSSSILSPSKQRRLALKMFEDFLGKDIYEHDIMYRTLPKINTVLSFHTRAYKYYSSKLRTSRAVTSSATIQNWYRRYSFDHFQALR